MSDHAADTPRLLLVEDDEDVVALLLRYFAGQGFEVRHAADGQAMRAALARERVDVVLLDLGLPGEDGLTLMRHLRSAWEGGVIMLTGRGDAVDRIVGLELGADDYITKPFDLRELLARVRSVLRRTAAAKTAQATPPASDAAVLRFAGFEMHPARRRLVSPRGDSVAITTGEFDLLALFVAEPGRVLSRDDLMNGLHGRESGPYDRAIDVGVGRLRRKLEEHGGAPDLIKSVRGAGYLLTAAVEGARA